MQQANEQDSYCRGVGSDDGTPAWLAATTTEAVHPTHRFIDVGVQLERFLAVRTLDFIHGGSAGYAQQVVGVPCRSHHQPPAPAPNLPQGPGGLLQQGLAVGAPPAC